MCWTTIFLKKEKGFFARIIETRRKHKNPDRVRNHSLQTAQKKDKSAISSRRGTVRMSERDVPLAIEQEKERGERLDRSLGERRRGEAWPGSIRRTGKKPAFSSFRPKKRFTHSRRDAKEGRVISCYPYHYGHKGEVSVLSSFKKKGGTTVQKKIKN